MILIGTSLLYGIIARRSIKVDLFISFFVFIGIMVIFAPH